MYKVLYFVEVANLWCVFMSDLYKNIHALCEKEGIKDGTLCANIGIRRSFLSELKAGRTKKLSTETLSKIADYFNVTVDSILAGEKEKPAIQTDSELYKDVDYIISQLEMMPLEKRKDRLKMIKKIVEEI